MIDFELPPGVKMTQQRFSLHAQHAVRVPFTTARCGSNGTILGRPPSMNTLAVGFDRALVGAGRGPAEPCDPHLHRESPPLMPSSAASSLGASPHRPSSP